MEPRELARLARSNALPETASPDSLPAIRAAMDGIERSERTADALAAIMRGEKHPAASRLHTALSAIGAKLAPLMNRDAANAWRDATALSLGKYTLRAAIYASEIAQGEPFQYGLGSVDARLHELAKEAQDRDAAALARLRMLARQIERSMTKKALPPPDDAPMTIAEIAATPDAYISMGRTLGYITDDEYQAAMALRGIQ